jgi:hypothetical protein
VDQNGFGGIQIAVQGDADNWGWHNTQVSGNWTDLDGILDYDNVDPFFIVVKLSDLGGWDDVAVADGTKGKFKLNQIPNQITITGGYLTNATLKMPSSDAKEFEGTGTGDNASGKGWAAQEVPEMPAE